MLRKIFAKMAKKPRFININHADVQASALKDIADKLYPCNLAPVLLLAGVGAVTTVMQDDLTRGAALMGIGYITALMTHHYPSWRIKRMAPKISSARIDTTGETPASAFNNLYEREAKALFIRHDYTAKVDTTASLLMLGWMGQNIVEGKDLLAPTIYGCIYLSLAAKSFRMMDTAEKIMSGAYTVCPTAYKMKAS